MASSRRLILEELRRRLLLIQIDNGFATDAGSFVFLGETVQLSPDDTTQAIAIDVQEDQVGELGLGDRLTPAAERFPVRLPVAVQAVAHASLAAPWITVEDVIADIKMAVEIADPWPEPVAEVTRGNTVPLEREEGSTFVGCEVVYEFLYEEVWGSP